MFFLGRKFYHIPGIYKPCHITEHIVVEILKLIDCKQFKDFSKISVLEIGSGTGCISISLKYETTKVNIVSIDKNINAIKNTKINKFVHRKDISIKLCNILQNKDLLKNNFDIIFSNPPYLEVHEFYEKHKQHKHKTDYIIKDYDNVVGGIEFINFIIRNATSKYIVLEISIHQIKKLYLYKRYEIYNISIPFINSMVAFVTLVYIC